MSAADSTAEFLRAIEATGFLAADQFHALNGWVQLKRPDTQEIARELNKRGWLTGFQIKEIFRGRGKSLAIGPYRILDLLGEGGMGRVFRALHTRLGREVALKVIRREKLANPMTVRRFRQEIQAVAQLSHPNVVLAFDADEAGGDHYLAMEYVDGVDLTKYVRDRGPLPVTVACDYVRQAALGLHHAYERGLVHRDVKPSNLIAAKTGQVKVLDLGLAMLNEGLGSESATRVTQEGFVIGTPDFLAPEQAQNPLHVDTRADIYSLGATLYYLLTGKVPYEGNNPTEKLMKHVSDPPPSLLKRLPTAPPQLDQLIQWLMAKDPKARPQTPMQVAAALAPFVPGASQPLPAYPPGGAPLGAVDPSGSSQIFRLPQSEAPARVRERIQGGGSRTTVLVGTVAVVLVGVLGYCLYRFTLMPDPAPDSEYANPLGMKFVLLKPGTFPMGSPEGEPGRGIEEGPVGDVTLDRAFYIGATEVTSGQFQQLMGKSPAWTAGRVRGGTDWPVESVSWTEAREFCKKLNERDRGRRRGWDYRLPTEAEWEYACRAGTQTAYSHGPELLPEHGETVQRPQPEPAEEDGKPKTTEMPAKVGLSKPNAFGLYDLHGNVAEWCQDYFARGYPDGARTNPIGPSSGDLRAVRGGAFDEPAARARSAARRGMQPDLRDRGVGFRIVLAPSP
jgi:formylglycine-generating enzyme required for sulfatase activity